MACGRAVALLALVARAGGIAVVGYVPDYHFNAIDWRKAVSQTTHLVLFSVDPQVDGLRNTESIQKILGEQSPLTTALRSAGPAAPKVLVGVGGLGRSQAFTEVLSNKKHRKRLAKQLVNLLQQHPLLSGLDFDLQVNGMPDWLSLAKLVLMLRAGLGSRGGEAPIMTMTFHAHMAVLQKFGPLTVRPQEGVEKRFVDLFDMCHAMTYTVMDQQGRHSSEAVDADLVQAWRKFGLPLERLTLGLPFFAVKSAQGAAPISYRQVAKDEPSAISSGLERTKDGYFFLNAENAAKKVHFAEEQGLAGLMIWELGQDVEDSGSLLRRIWDTAKNKGFAQKFLGWTPKEDHLFSLLTLLMGGYYFLKVMQLAMRPSPQPLKPQVKSEEPKVE